MSDQTEKKLGIKESMELAQWARQVASDLVNHMGDDGKVSGFEVAQTLISNAPSAVKAFSGMDQMQAELADLNDAEKERLVSELMGMAMLLVKAFYKGDAA